MSVVAESCTKNTKYRVKLILDQSSKFDKYYANIKEISFEDKEIEENVTDNLRLFRSLLPHLDVSAERVDETAKAMSLLVEDALSDCMRGPAPKANASKFFKVFSKAIEEACRIFAKGTYAPENRRQPQQGA